MDKPFGFYRGQWAKVFFNFPNGRGNETLFRTSIYEI